MCQCTPSASKPGGIFKIPNCALKNVYFIKNINLSYKYLCYTVYALFYITLSIFYVIY